MSSMDQIIDSLPYADKEHESDEVRKKVMDLIDAEANNPEHINERSASDLPSCSNEFVTERMRQEFNRISNDIALSHLATMPTNQLPQSDNNRLDSLMENCDKLKILISNMNQRCANLETETKHGTEAWKSYLTSLQHTKQSLYPSQLEQSEKLQQETNWRRRTSQLKGAQKFTYLESVWKESIDKNYRIEAASGTIERMTK